MFLAAANSRVARLARLAGLALITLSVLTSKAAPATSGRGLVVLLAFVPAFVAWLVWTLWSSRQTPMTADLYVIAICGGVIQTASPNSAGSALTFVAAMAAAARAGLLQGLIVAALGGAAVGVGAIVYDHTPLSVLAYALGFAAVTLGGANIRQSRMRLEQAELLLAQTQRSHEEQLRAARLEESARIARDIHDVLAHTLAGLVIQLEATDAQLEQGVDAGSIRERVQRAEALAREGLQEARRAVGALRGEVGEPAPAMIRSLIDQYESPIDFTLAGDVTRLDGQVGEAAVRVIQEALTNVRKHAPGAEVRVALAVHDDAVDLTIEDRLLVGVASSALRASGGGYGLQGMRERAAQLGGTLAAGPVAEGWRVALHLPLNPRT